MRRCILVLFGGLVATFAALGLAALPAGAHHALLSGSASCPGGAAGADHVIAWSIGNSQPKEPMTITSAKAMLGGTSYPVTGYTSPVAPAGSTSAQTVVPGALTGSVTLWVEGEWTDGHTSGRHVSVALTTPCGDTSTTIPSPTTSMPTPTSVSEPPSVSSSVPVATVPPSGTGGGSLAFTGAGTAVGGALGFGLVATGLALRGRRKRTFSER